MEYINKAAVVAEIDRQIKLFGSENYKGSDRLTIEERLFTLNSIKEFIETLEVKEVDLEKEISNYLYSHLGRPRMELELDWTQCDISCKADKLVAFAQHFFELGLKAQKGE